ncbi:MAG: hypothetical protein Ta2G_22140 [Termitinemataceae bacterium]|nr:MAG: hypothetical protein Ta2G_22140 [Termitinemataceae bacterium]
MELLLKSPPAVERESSGIGRSFRKSALTDEEQAKLFDAIKVKLDAYLIKHNVLQGFILEFPKGAGSVGKNSFYKLVSGQVSAFGAAIRLGSKRTLVLLPSGLDSALIAHRICKNIKTRALLFFEAGNSASIIALIKKY